MKEHEVAFIVAKSEERYKKDIRDFLTVAFKEFFKDTPVKCSKQELFDHFGEFNGMMASFAEEMIFQWFKAALSNPNFVGESTAASIKNILHIMIDSITTDMMEKENENIQS